MKKYLILMAVPIVGLAEAKIASDQEGLSNITFRVEDVHNLNF